MCPSQHPPPDVLELCETWGGATKQCNAAKEYKAYLEGCGGGPYRIADTGCEGSIDRSLKREGGTNGDDHEGQQQKSIFMKSIY